MSDKNNNSPLLSALFDTGDVKYLMRNGLGISAMIMAFLIGKRVIEKRLVNDPEHLSIETDCISEVNPSLYKSLISLEQLIVLLQEHFGPNIVKDYEKIVSAIDVICTCQKLIDQQNDMKSNKKRAKAMSRIGENSTIVKNIVNNIRSHISHSSDVKLMVKVNEVLDDVYQKTERMCFNSIQQVTQ